MNLTEFYPTPEHLIIKMLAGIDTNEIETVLEPSAGKGDIAESVASFLKAGAYHYNDLNNYADKIDCIEIDENLRHILKGKCYRVVHDDFLTYQTFKRYNLIIMNPPFSDGDKHLTKALEMQRYGGHIRCLLNAETLRNPYTNLRKALVRQLEELNAEIEYLHDEFTSAERATCVEVALIKVDMPYSLPESLILDGLHRARKMESKSQNPDAVTHADFIEAIVEKYRFEVKAGLWLIAEYEALKPYILESLDKDNNYNEPVLELNFKRGCHSDNKNNGYVECIRIKYWQALFQSPKFTGQLTRNLRTELDAKVEELRNYEFSAVNIAEIRRQLSLQTVSSIEKTIVQLFDDLSHKYSWLDETSKNIHYFDGWKTNKAYKINKKVIIPMYRAIETGWKGKINLSWNAGQQLSDIEKCLDFLDAGLPDSQGINERLDYAISNGYTRNITLKHFTVTFYKKGTCHLVFNNEALLAKFNLFGCQRKGWLPPTYGKKSYQDMTAEDRAVIDAYEGADAYSNVMTNPEYYIVEPEGLLKIAA